MLELVLEVFYHNKNKINNNVTKDSFFIKLHNNKQQYDDWLTPQVKIFGKDGN